MTKLVNRLHLGLTMAIMVVGMMLTTAAVHADGFEVPRGGANAKADHIIVEKAARRLSLYAEGSLLRRYQVALGGNPAGPKRREGDRRTPEGVYLITDRNADSAYHRSLRISYPSLMDASRALQAGYNPGGQIMIHGIGANRPDLRRLHGRVDWTDGCIAVTDAEMDEIWALVDEGTLIDIRP